MASLLIAHPGHELLLHGWISRNKPSVHVLTDAAAHSSGTRLGTTAELLRSVGAHPGAIFGRLGDAEAYEMILERNHALLVSLTEELADSLKRERPAIVVSDSAEGYNPVHDLCRLIAGAAIELAGVSTRHYEYAVVNDPRSLDSAAIVVELNDAEYAAKMASAVAQAATLPDVEVLLAQYGPDAFRREILSPVRDWAVIDSGAPPLYERHGEEGVSAGQYTTVIRQREHMLPLRDALRAAVEKRTCAF
jgi:hypothetical protein